MKCAILGFGNPVRGDDAVGCQVIEKLQDKLKDHKAHISLFDMGTSGFEILFALPGHSKIIVVDAVLDSQDKIGQLYRVPAEEVLRAPEQDPLLFLHGMKWNQGLSYAKKIMGESYPQDVEAYLISISNTSFVEAMQPEVEKARDEVIELIYKEVLSWLN
jgi:hydrogenase maturation protease